MRAFTEPTSARLADSAFYSPESLEKTLCGRMGFGPLPMIGQFMDAMFGTLRRALREFGLSTAIHSARGDKCGSGGTRAAKSRYFYFKALCGVAEGVTRPGLTRNVLQARRSGAKPFFFHGIQDVCFNAPMSRVKFSGALHHTTRQA